MKTVPNQNSVKAFIENVSHEGRRADAKTICGMLQEVSGEVPQMWGPSIIGFGSYHYIYDSGREGDMMLTGFSPRKQSLVLYIMNGCERYEKQLQAMGPYKTGKSCLYLKNLKDINLEILREIVQDSISRIKKKYP